MSSSKRASTSSGETDASSSQASVKRPRLSPYAPKLAPRQGGAPARSGARAESASGNEDEDAPPRNDRASGRTRDGDDDDDHEDKPESCRRTRTSTGSLKPIAMYQLDHPPESLIHPRRAKTPVRSASQTPKAPQASQPRRASQAGKKTAVEKGKGRASSSSTASKVITQLCATDKHTLTSRATRPSPRKRSGKTLTATRHPQNHPSRTTARTRQSRRIAPSPTLPLLLPLRQRPSIPLSSAPSFSLAYLVQCKSRSLPRRQRSRQRA